MIFTCCRCNKEFKYGQSYRKHLEKFTCKPAVGTPSYNRLHKNPEAMSRVEPSFEVSRLAAKLEKLEVDLELANRRIQLVESKNQELVCELGNVKRSLYWVKTSQKEANARLLLTDAELRKETLDLQHKQFLCRLREQRLSQATKEV